MLRVMLLMLCSFIYTNNHLFTILTHIRSLCASHVLWRIFPSLWNDCVSVWSAILFIAWPREELQLACAGRRWWGLRLSLLTRRASVCAWGENQRLWCKALSASSLYPLPLLRLEFISVPPFSSQSGKTSPGNSLDYPIIFLLHHGWGDWLKYPPGFSSLQDST